jgi:hypothetical protein
MNLQLCKIVSNTRERLFIGLPPVGPGLRPVLCLAVFSAILLDKPNPYNSSKTFFILFLTSNKTVSKIKPVEKDTFSLRINWKPLYIGRRRRPGTFAPFSLQLFWINGKFSKPRNINLKILFI